MKKFEKIVLDEVIVEEFSWRTTAQYCNHIRRIAEKYPAAQWPDMQITQWDDGQRGAVGKGTFDADVYNINEIETELAQKQSREPNIITLPPERDC